MVCMSLHCSGDHQLLVRTTHSIAEITYVSKVVVVAIVSKWLLLLPTSTYNLSHRETTYVSK
jgi:hypothetical protein